MLRSRPSERGAHSDDRGVASLTRTTRRGEVNRAYRSSVPFSPSLFRPPMDAGSPPLSTGRRPEDRCNRRAVCRPVKQPVGRSTGWPSHHLQPTERAAQRFYTFRISHGGGEFGGWLRQVVEKIQEKEWKASRPSTEFLAIRTVKHGRLCGFAARGGGDAEVS